MPLKTAVTKSGICIASSKSTQNVSIFLGIPYAKAPVQALRWRSPQPLEAWSEARLCESYGASASQPCKLPHDFYTKEFPSERDEHFDEDCLYLNIYTPALHEDEALPVLINIHGGAFMRGSGREVQFDGSSLSEKGVIIVQINYRLGIFGFLAHPWLSKEEDCGNFGIADQIAAITWIHEHIQAFGGDPQNITLMGQSAGAMSIQLLLTAPKMKGLIKQAIMQSGGGILKGMKSSAYEHALSVGAMIVERTQIESLEELRFAPIAQLHKALFRVMNETKQFMLCVPCVRTKLLPFTIEEAVKAGCYQKIKILMGSNKSEKPYEEMAKRFQEGILKFTNVMLSEGLDAPYLYHFERKLPGDHAGAFHSGELWYVFGSLKYCWRPFISSDYALSETMMNAWVNFAKCGNPRIVDWKPYAGTKETIYSFDIIC